MGNQKVSYLIFLCCTVIFLSGCTQTISKLQQYKKEFFSSYDTKNELQNLQKHKQQYELYEKNFQIDEIITLEDIRLSKDKGHMGLWLPSKFLKENQAGLYFLEKFDPSKKVIVFIHGAGGNAIEWRDIIDSFDKNDFQALVLSYPSGIELDVTAGLVSGSLKKLASKYNIENYIIIAHSMGGLVAKKVIGNLNTAKQFTDTFISLSTPWGGHEAAKDVKELPYYISSWNDMRSNSKFIQGLENNFLLDGVNHYLLFGYKGEDRFFSRDNDGVISLQSQLKAYAQRGAKKIFGFNETHVGILRSKEVILVINNILKNKL